MNILDKIKQVAPAVSRSVGQAYKNFYVDAPKEIYKKAIYEPILHRRAGVNMLPNYQVVDPTNFPHARAAVRRKMAVTPEYSNRFLPVNQQLQPFGNNRNKIQRPIQGSYNLPLYLEDTNDF